MKRLLLILALFLPSLAGAQVFRQPGYCQYGGIPAVVQGLASSNDLMGSYPGCTVDVFISGTNTHATIYSDSVMTPLANPFTADVITGKFGFYAAAGCYDVTISGAGLPAPDTTPAVCLATSVTAGTVTSVTQTNNASALISVGLVNNTTTPAFTFGLTQFSAHTFWGNGTGSTATPSATVIGVGDLPFTYTGNQTKIVTAGTVSGSAGTPLCLDGSLNATTVGCPSAAGYQTIQNEGSPLTQRAVVNFIGAGVDCVDNSGSLRTDCTISLSAVSGSGTINHIVKWTGPSTIGDSNFATEDATFYSICYPAGSCATGPFLQIGASSATGNIIMQGQTVSIKSFGSSSDISLRHADGRAVNIIAASGSNGAKLSLFGGTSGQFDLTTSAAAALGSSNGGINLSTLLTDCQTGTTCSPAVFLNPNFFIGRTTLSGGTATVTAISPAFASTSAGFCWATDATTPANVATVVIASTTSLTITGTGTDTINWICFAKH